MQFGDIRHFKTASGKSHRWSLCPLEPVPVSVLEKLHSDRAAISEYCAANCPVGRWHDFFVAARSRAGQCLQNIIALLHFYCDIVAVLCESEMGV